MKIMITVQDIYPARRNALFCEGVRSKALTVTDMLFKEERNYGYKISNPESIPS